MKQFSNLKRAFLPCLFVLLTLPAWGQMQPVTKNFRKTPLKNVLKEVEAQTGLSIMYDTRELNLERPVTASFDRTPVSQVLREVLDRTVQYSIKDKMIVIYKASATPPPAAGTGKTLTGTVLDETGAPMVGAAVATPDGRRGTVTDSNGRYSLTLGAGDALISVSYLGYVTRQIVIGDRTEVDVNLVPDAKNTINEVVVIGYGAVKKSDLTGSVSNVKMSDIRDVPNTSVDQALQGRIAGVDIMSTSGAPGATTSIRVRGTRSISASNEPLIVVDGVIDAVSDLNDINSADIEQISVLKDASSTAIYGSRGANGVIIVTTRQGVTSKPSVTAKAEFGVSKLARDLPFARSLRHDHQRLSVRRHAVGVVLPFACGQSQPDVGENHALQCGSRFLGLRRPPEHHRRRLLFDHPRPAAFLADDPYDGLHEPFHEPGQDVEPRRRGLGREP